MIISLIFDYNLNLMDTLQEYRIQNIKAVHITVFLIILIGLSSSSEIQYKNLSQFIEHHRS